MHVLKAIERAIHCRNSSCRGPVASIGEAHQEASRQWLCDICMSGSIQDSKFLQILTPFCAAMNSLLLSAASGSVHWAMIFGVDEIWLLANPFKSTRQKVKPIFRGYFRLPEHLGRTFTNAASKINAWTSPFTSRYEGNDISLQKLGRNWNSTLLAANRRGELGRLILLRF